MANVNVTNRDALWQTLFHQYVDVAFVRWTKEAAARKRDDCVCLSFGFSLFFPTVIFYFFYSSFFFFSFEYKCAYRDCLTVLLSTNGRAGHVTRWLVTCTVCTSSTWLVFSFFAGFPSWSLYILFFVFISSETTDDGAVFGAAREKQLAFRTRSKETKHTDKRESENDSQVKWPKVNSYRGNRLRYLG